MKVTVIIPVLVGFVALISFAEELFGIRERATPIYTEESAKVTEVVSYSADEEGTVLYDGKGILVRHVGIDDEGIRLCVQNDYALTVMFEMEGLAINRVMADVIQSSEVKKGKREEITVPWKEFFPTLRVGKVKSIRFNFTLSAESGLEVSKLAAIDRGDTSSYERTIPSKRKIFDSSGIKVYFSGLEEGNGLYPTEAEVVLVNETDHIAVFDMYGGKVNGKNADSFGISTVYPDCIAYAKVGIEKYRKEDIRTVLWNLSVCNEHDQEIIRTVHTSEIKIR